MLTKSLLLLSSLMILAGCATQRIPFNESEYSVRPNSGDKVVSGQIFLIDQMEQKQVGDGSEITMEPVTSYSRQWYEVSYLNSRSLAEPDRRYGQYVLKTKADKEGGFTFDKVAPGEYFLSGLVKWRAATCSGNVVNKKIPICQKVSVKPGDSKVEVPLTKPFVSPSEICSLYSQSDWSKE